MPAEILNLRLARKRRRRGLAEQEAEANRIRHGTPKALREETRSEQERATRLLNGVKLDCRAAAETEASPSGGDVPPGSGKRT